MPVCLRPSLIRRGFVVSFLFENPNDDQQIACQTQHGSDDNPTGREDVGIEGLICATRTSHQDVTNNDQHTCYDEDAATDRAEDERTISLV